MTGTGGLSAARGRRSSGGGDAFGADNGAASRAREG